MKIGLIAGAGQFPVLFSKKAVKKGYQVYAVGFNSEADETLCNHVQQLEWIFLGQISKLLKYFKKHQITQAVMLGSINKINIFKDVRPDFKALSFIAATVKTHDNSTLTSFADLLLKEGIEILPSTPSQDLRFDLPSSGLQTIEIMHKAGARVLVLEAQKSISFDRDEMTALADQYKISIIGLTDDDIIKGRI